MPYLLGNQSGNTNSEDDYGKRVVVMFLITMAKGINPNAKGQKDHEIFKRLIVNYIYA